ncbi:MAG: DJ-1/PfpI family protein [Prevotellaceae bacterium]|jgi:4-methyl-5(b-hydroxyethyl)-thiazole monophosphate biosynthesis|nr:DJ-1/PfpI family protein [Prevotellaceae bacterium]
MKKCYVFLTTGFEEIEAVATIDILRRADLNVVTVSVEDSIDVQGSHNVTVMADTKFADNNYSDAEILVLPGGTLRLSEFEYLTELLKKHNSEGKKIAAICAAPAILGKLGILEGKTATCYPSFEKYLTGAQVVDKRVVKSENVITGMGPGCTKQFALEIVLTLLGQEKTDEVAEALIA